MLNKARLLLMVFNKCLDKLLSLEGGKSDNKSDLGGRTNYGVTQGTYDTYLLAQGKEKQNVYNIQPNDSNRIITDCLWS